MAQNVTTVLDKTELTAENISASIDDFIYVIRGTGSNRDRKMSLAELKKFMQVMMELLFQKGFTGGVNEVTIDGDGIELKAEGSGLADNSHLGIERTGILLQKSSQGSEDDVSISPTKISVNHTDSETKKTDITNDSVDTSNLYAKTIVGNNKSGETGRYVNIDSTVEIGGVPNSTNGGDLVVNGSTTLKGKLKGRTAVEQLNVPTANILMTDADYDLVNDSGLSPAIGDIVIVRNTKASESTSSLNKIDIKLGYRLDQSQGVIYFKHVNLPGYCSMMFVCTGLANTNDSVEWDPISIDLQNPVKWEATV